MPDREIELMDSPPDGEKLRLHALDNLRAITMWLGIVLHVAAQHLIGESPFPWHDSQTSLGANLLVSFIHSFRMPAFFILAGFFVALLVSRRDFKGMLKHRMRRVGLPFLIFWPPVFVAVMLVAMLYLHVMAKGSFGLDPGIIPPDTGKPVINTLHLWFLYYLLWFCVLSAAIGIATRRIPLPIKEGVAEIWRVLAARWWGFLILALPLAAVGSFYKMGLLMPSGSFIPSPAELIHNGMFFLFGWYLYRNQETLLASYSRYCWRYLFGGGVFYAVFLGTLEHALKAPESMPHAAWLLAYLYNCVSWLWSIALIGLFLRHLSKQNAVLRYISDSSYWVYLVHLIGTIGFGALLYKLPLGVFSKISLNVLATTAICLLSYHLLVRFTPLGTLLNGRRFRFKAGQKKAEELPAQERAKQGM